MVCLHDGGLGHGRDHFLLALVLCILHLVVRLSHCRLFLRWAILFALFLFLCALLHLGFGEVVHSFVCVLLAGRCQYQLSYAILSFPNNKGRPPSRSYHEVTESSLKVPVLTRIRP